METSIIAGLGPQLFSVCIFHSNLVQLLKYKLEGNVESKFVINLSVGPIFIPNSETRTSFLASVVRPCCGSDHTSRPGSCRLCLLGVCALGTAGRG